jgi:cytochrome c-type biogenesis protein CcmH/NrfG
VLFGVGSSGSVGLQDILQNDGGGGGATTEVSSADLTAALAATKAKPNDAAAWVTLGKAYQATAAEDASKNRTKPAQTNYDKAVQAYVKASTINKTDVDILKGLATAYVAQGSALSTEIGTLQNEASLVQAGASPESTLLPSGLNTPDAVSAAANTQISEQVAALQAKITPLQTAADKATLASYDVWKRLTVLQKDDPAVWFEFAGAAVSAADGISATDTAKLDAVKADAITGYKKFLELAPGDPLAAQVQAAVDQLEGKTDTTATAGTGAATDTAAAATTAAGTTATTP